MRVNYGLSIALAKIISDHCLLFYFYFKLNDRGYLGTARLYWRQRINDELNVTKIAIFADVQNIYYTSRQAFGKQFNYRALWQQVRSGGEIVSATAYAIHRGDEGQLKFQSALKNIGFNVRLKPYIQRADGSAKGDWDVGITIDIMAIAAQVDTVVLLSGDGDFDLLLEKIKQDYHCHTVVYGVQALTANSLIEACDHYHPIGKSLLM